MAESAKSTDSEISDSSSLFAWDSKHEDEHEYEDGDKEEDEDGDEGEHEEEQVTELGSQQVFDGRKEEVEEVQDEVRVKTEQEENEEREEENETDHPKVAVFRLPEQLNIDKLVYDPSLLRMGILIKTISLHQFTKFSVASLGILEDLISCLPALS